MKKIAFILLVLVAFCSYANADSWRFHLKIKSTQLVSSYDGGPAKGLYVYCSDENNIEYSYKYLFNANGNSLEYGKALMSAFATAKAIGNEVRIQVKSAPANDEIVAVQF